MENEGPYKKHRQVIKSQGCQRKEGEKRGSGSRSLRVGLGIRTVATDTENNNKYGKQYEKLYFQDEGYKCRNAEQMLK